MACNNSDVLNILSKNFALTNYKPYFYDLYIKANITIYNSKSGLPIVSNDHKTSEELIIEYEAQKLLSGIIKSNLFHYNCIEIKINGLNNGFEINPKRVEAFSKWIFNIFIKEYGIQQNHSPIFDDIFPYHNFFIKIARFFTQVLYAESFSPEKEA